mmetsp:Transcript_82482/g.197898  ORF Transcript_82482/g.197898 Transcript_82482/m.197898 type:complete len:350 (-) Transcript_82482:408-1457(-)
MQRGRQQLRHGLLVIRRQRVRKLNGEDEEQVAMHKRILEGRHSLVFDRLHHAEGLLCIGICHHIHRASAPSLLGGNGFLSGALLEVGTLAIDDEAPHIDALSLELGLARLLQRVDVRGVGLRDVLYGGAVCILDDFPLGLALLFGQRVEALGHGLHDLTWLCLDEKLPTVQVRELHLEAAEGLDQGDLALHVEVGAFPLEVVVLLLLQHEDHISGVCIRVLVCHFPEGDLVAIWRALLHVHLQHLPLLLRLEALALATTGVALRLHLLNHGPHAHDLDLHAAAVAFPTLLDALLLVDDLSSDGHLLGESAVHLLESDLEILHHILGLLAPSLSTPTPAAASPEEGFEDV